MPVAGLTVTGIQEKDRDQERVQDLPLLTVAANASIEWATDYFALLVGASFPFDVQGQPPALDRRPRPQPLPLLRRSPPAEVMPG